MRNRLKDSIFPQSALHFFQADGFFVPTLGHNREVMQVFHQSLEAPERKKHACLLALRIHDELLLQDAHSGLPSYWATVTVAHHRIIRQSVPTGSTSSMPRRPNDPRRSSGDPDCGAASGDGRR